jgi:simple sugar transport system permease protein
MKETVVEDQLDAEQKPSAFSRQRLVSLAAPVLGVLLGLFIGGILILIAGESPLEVYAAMLYGAFGGQRQITETLLKTGPLLLMGLGLTVAFRAKVWNIGGEGQYYIGALVGGVIALYFAHWWRPILLAAMIVGGLIGGALWALIPAIFKVKNGINEIITTLMFNFIALFLVSYLVRGPLQDPDGVYPQTARFDPVTQLPDLLGTRLHSGLLLALVLVPVIYVLLWQTPLGFRLRAVGSSAFVARYAGINVERTIVFVMIFSGALAGLTGLIEVSTLHTRLKGTITGGYGFSGILVALLGRLNPFGVAAAALFFAALTIGAEAMHVVAGLPPALADAIQAIIVLSVLIVDAVARRRLV